MSTDDWDLTVPAATPPGIYSGPGIQYQVSGGRGMIIGWLIARDEENTTGDGPVYEGDRDAAIWTVYRWNRDNDQSDGWAEALHPGGLTYDDAMTLARGMGFTGDPVGL